MSTPIQVFFAARWPKLLQNESFVLRLESQMLFPELNANSIPLDYACFLALSTLPMLLEDTFPKQESVESPPPRGAMGPKLVLNDSPASEPVVFGPPLDMTETNAGYWAEMRQADLERSDAELRRSAVSMSWGNSEAVPSPIPLQKQPPSAAIKINLNNHHVLEPFRVVSQLNASYANSKALTESLAKLTIDGQVASVCLDLFRLLKATGLRTSGGRPAKPSKNLVSYVCAMHNLGRTRRSSGRPSNLEPRPYPDLDEKQVVRIWNKYSHTSALWAAYRALCQNPFGTLSGPTLLSGIDANEFTRLAIAFEEERLGTAPERAASDAELNPKSLDQELRMALEAHVPTYRANN
jgi:hypothetical protein